MAHFIPQNFIPVWGNTNTVMNTHFVPAPVANSSGREPLPPAPSVLGSGRIPVPNQGTPSAAVPNSDVMDVDDVPSVRVPLKEVRASVSLQGARKRALALRGGMRII